MEGLDVTSPVFLHGEPIPSKYTCEGSNRSPSLKIGKIPKQAKSLAIIVDDPDAPSGVFVHWLAWNIDPAGSGLEENAKVPDEGVNGFGSKGYKGPCPPKGNPHRYFFKVYALDTLLQLPHSSDKEKLLQAMKNHIISQGELVGTYKRS